MFNIFHNDNNNDNNKNKTYGDDCGRFMHNISGYVRRGLDYIILSRTCK